MTTAEVFNQRRMDRCIAIQRSIMDSWRLNNSFQYVVRATESVEGLSLADLRKQYVTVGVGERLTEIPFHDMLVVFSLIEQEFTALKNRTKSSATEFTIKFQISTDFTDDEAARLLSQIHIETPHDKGKRLRIVATQFPADDQDDDHHT